MYTEPKCNYWKVVGGAKSSKWGDITFQYRVEIFVYLMNLSGNARCSWSWHYEKIRWEACEIVQKKQYKNGKSSRRQWHVTEVHEGENLRRLSSGWKGGGFGGSLIINVAGEEQETWLWYHMVWYLHSAECRAVDFKLMNKKHLHLHHPSCSCVSTANNIIILCMGNL